VIEGYGRIAATVTAVRPWISKTKRETAISAMRNSQIKLDSVVDVRLP
jgi:hypothetical protein